MSDEIPFKEKIKSIQFSPAATPSRRNNIPPKVNTSSNSWERGVVTDDRNMPLLDDKLQPVGLKQYAQERTKYSEGFKETAYRAEEAQKDKG